MAAILEDPHFSAAPLFREMRAGYVKLLEDHRLESSEQARKALEQPLCQLWMADYKLMCQRQTFLEILDDRVASFLHDSAGYEGVADIDRVVSAFSVSQERALLGDLLARLQAEREKGTASAKTLSLIRQAFIAFSEGLTVRKLEILTQAATRVLGWDLLPLPALMDRWISLYQMASASWRPKILKRLTEVLQSRTQAFGSLNAEDLDSLRVLAARAEEELDPESRGGLRRELTGLLRPALRELEDRLARDPDPGLIERAREHLLALDFVEKPRPRYSKGARHLRRGLGWKTDLGHFIPHSAGGPADINLFQQDRRLNRGWSPQGRAYRTMEKYLAEHPNLFHFTRAIYNSETTIPRYLEMGILLPHAQAKELEPTQRQYEGCYFCFPQKSGCGAEVAWWIGLFDNQPAEAV